MRPIKKILVWLLALFKLRRLPGSRRVALTAVVEGAVLIGDYTYIGGYSELRGVLGKIRIGRYCSIGRSVKIFSSGQAHRFDGFSTYPFYMLDSVIDRSKYNIKKPDTVIGNDVWIGSNSIIMAGVDVGDGAVIGAGAIVTRSVEPFTIVAGSPAKVVGRRFSDEIQAKVQSSGWWNLDYRELKTRYASALADNRVP